MRAFVPLLIALLLFGWPAPAEAAPDGKVAVVDMLDLLEHHPDTVALRNKLTQDEVAARDRLKLSQERLEKLRKEIILLPDNAERRRKKTRFDKQAWNDEYDFKGMLNEAQYEYVRELERIHAGVIAIIGDYARKNGISVVMQMTDDVLGAVDRNDYVMKVALRTVVYFEPSLNITEQIRALFPK